MSILAWARRRYVFPTECQFLLFESPYLPMAGLRNMEVIAEWMAQIDTDAMCFSIQIKGACGIICSLLNWKPDERRKRCSIRK
jgi:hypothetical protein